MLGYEPGAFIGHPEFWAQYPHPEDRPSVLAEISASGRRDGLPSSTVCATRTAAIGGYVKKRKFA